MKHKKTQSVFKGTAIAAGFIIAIVSAVAADKESGKTSARMDLAPHSVMIESSLKTALEQLKGLRAEVKVLENQAPTPLFIQHFKMFEQGINSELQMAKVHQNELQAGVQKFPAIAKSSNFQATIPAFTEAYNTSTTWRAKAGHKDYWKNTKTVESDLDRLETQINAALDKTKSFNADQLDISNIG